MPCWQGVVTITVMLTVLVSVASAQQGCVCTMDYTPVCAKGVTHSNSCTARCAGVLAQDIKPGACRGAALRPRQPLPMVARTTAAVALPSTGPRITRTKPAKDHLVVWSQGSIGYIDLMALKAANPGKCCINLGAQTVRSVVSAASYYVSPPNDRECKMKTCPSNPAGLRAQAVYVCGCKGGACCPKYP